MSTPVPLYLPPGCQPLSAIKSLPQIRVGLQGYGGTGKTFAALTFPNPIVVNLDRGLGAHVGREDVIEVPLYDAAYCKTIDPNFEPSRKKDLLLTWLEKHGSKLTAEQTLVWDGNTPTQNAYHVWYEANKHRFLTNQGKINEFAEWNQKIPYYSTMFDMFKSLPCHVVFICHEVDKKEGGKYAGKVRPLLTGQMGDELVSHFTDFFRQHVSSKPKDVNAVPDDTLKLWGMNRTEFKAMLDSFKGESVYYWQTQSDDIFDGKTSSMVNPPRFVPATYESFVKYRRKIS